MSNQEKLEDILEMYPEIEEYRQDLEDIVEASETPTLTVVQQITYNETKDVYGWEVAIMDVSTEPHAFSHSQKFILQEKIDD